MIDHGVDNYPLFLYELARLLRPDGVLLLVKPELRLYNERREPMNDPDEGTEGFLYIQKLMMTVNNAIKWAP